MVRVLSSNDPQMGIWVDPSTLTAFQTCLFQLRGILRELKTSTSISAATTAAPPPPAGPSGGEAEAIMETLQTAIRELAARMPPPRRVEVDGRQNSQDALFRLGYDRKGSFSQIIEERARVLMDFNNRLSFLFKQSAVGGGGPTATAALGRQRP